MLRECAEEKFVGTGSQSPAVDTKWLLKVGNPSSGLSHHKLLPVAKFRGNFAVSTGLWMYT
ncbi:MAG: hypothetical protein HC903_17220 [Methylacidiphilales bacterium]|nr:hypothetical protein [Candidatus Methylacidiphilales bacterium]NJR14457.1 hypothetical protein [Calothrix sp. CSU_2_0]